ncbi:MAG: EthD domain-containing protein [Pseudomonadota bacterium]|nr:EthD domain-containing protein [Pseudomonadota bacterium]
MIKLSFCLTRQNHLTREEFQDYWINNHAPLVKSVSKDLKIIKYHQIHCKDYDFLNTTRKARVPDGKLPNEYDGIAEIYWDSWDDLKSLSDDEKARDAGKILLDDEAKFINFEKSPLMFSEINKIIK